MTRYDPQAIEAKWQRIWEERGTYVAPGPGDPAFDPSRPKFYVLDMFPYPSGEGLHVGHPIGYIGTDIVARHKRMTGHNVLHPMGFDAFGLPAEQYAVETGIHPRETTERNVARYREQLERFGLSFDWSRTLATTDPGYYKWTQWIFLRLFHSWYDREAARARPIPELVAALEGGELFAGAAGPTPDAAAGRPWSDVSAAERRVFLDAQRLAYLDEVEVNWCPALGTVLANEEVTNEGLSDRGNHPVYRRPLRQWMLRITSYADRLIDDLDLIDWPESIKVMQRNWIGRSSGADVSFPVVGADGDILVYTTRPDTLFGATFMVLAPEHPLVDVVTTDEHREAIERYRRRAAAESELARVAETRDKTGEFTGGYAVNPVNGERIPIWIADYVLMTYGTGAIMAVPAGDQRDFEFAIQFHLPVRAVVVPPDEWLEAKAAEVDALGEGAAVDEIRSHYLAHPEQFPEAYVDYAVAVNSANDGVSLDGLPSAEAIAAITEWLEREGRGTGQIRYRLRDWLFSRQRYWGEPIPILHGPDGELRAVPDDDLPLLLPPLDDFRPDASDDRHAEPKPALSRAPEEWQTVEIDCFTYRRELNTMPQWAGSCWYYHVSTPEPFARLFNQGYILAPAYVDSRGIYVPADEVEERPDGTFFHPEYGDLTQSAGKMGKSLKNSVHPEDIFEQYGFDTLRLYAMYMGPLAVSKPWTTRDIVGVHRFLHRAWRNFVDQDSGELLVVDEPADEDLRRALHRTIAAVSEDVEDMRFNTAIARLIELNNELVGRDTVPREVAEPFLLMLAPFAPHFGEELWERLGHDTSIVHAPWPAYDEKYLVVDTVEVVVQVDGKVRSRIQASADASDAELEAAARADERVAGHLEGATVRKVVVVPGRLVNFVTG